ncbi:MAG: UvrD-helicase domain-containing protein [Eubacterium sp.]|nr:UvrD-helicase domain-containing protein [Eubacterium sp.]
MDWTKGQQDIIDARDCEVLVSAAAGSGKTTVLVERIYQRVMDPENPVDIDRFVVVTFTNAAAAEMKERLRNRMEKALKEEKLEAGRKAHLRRQLRLVASAHVSTVHSFCSYVIGQYFHRIGIDPSYSLASESEIRLIRHEVVDELLRDEYEEEREDFQRIAGLFSLNRFDTRLEDWILKIYEKSVSEPFPDLLLAEWERNLTTPVKEESSPWIRELVRQEADLARGILGRSRSLEKEFYDLDEKYFRTIILLKEISEQMFLAGEGMKEGRLSPLQAYEEIRLALMGAEFRGGLPKDTPEAKPELDAACRAVKPVRVALEEQKKIVKTLEEIDREREQMAETCLTFLRLVREFTERFSQAKREKGLADFGDLEQFALQILYDRDEKTGQRTRSEAARELADGFIEVMIDEYQDSNRVQDTILWAVSRAEEEEGKQPWECLSKNRFMVGDIKQSIYRFRNACPELFETKMRIFREGDGTEHRLLGLQNNFRSARSVIDATNAVFREVMHEDIGGVEYDPEAELTFSAILPEPEKGARVADRVEIDELEAEASYRVRDEATHIAGRILEMVEGEDPLYVREGDGYRPVRYRDIVILSRDVSPVAYEYAEVFRRYGVPFYTKQKEGFYGSREISLILQMLAVIDNPRQDIPLAGVVASPMFGITEEMLAEIRIHCPLQGSYDLYDRLVWAADREGETGERVGAFLSLLTELREKASGTTISIMMEDIFQRTGIYDYFAEGPDGERRSGNLDYLLHIVTQYERGSFSGVHAFIEYVEQMISREEDEGEPLLIGEQEDVVRLMSMHKSKGLEFPVVIIPRMESEGRRSEGGRFVMDTELGIAGYVDDIRAGFYKKPLLYRLLINKNNSGNLGELLRLFYVAMTRAKDQLIVVRWGGEPVQEQEDSGYFTRSGMWAFFSMMRPAICRDKEENLFRVHRIRYEEEREKIGDLAERVRDARRERVNNFDTTGRYNVTVPPLEKEAGEEPLPAKISVSDLKKASFEEEDTELVFRQEATETGTEEEPDPEDIPAFMRESGSRLTGVERGTIYHQVMAVMDFTDFSQFGADRVDWFSAVESGLDRLVAERHLRREEKETVKVGDLVTFFTGKLGQRMIAAAGRGQLHREQPFILSKSSREIPLYADRPESPVMIQGIIDGYFEEDGEIVLMDYKTDRFDGEDENLIRRYHIQLELYREALEKLVGKKVKECYLYSFFRGYEIRIPDPADKEEV